MIQHAFRLLGRGRVGEGSLPVLPKVDMRHTIFSLLLLGSILPPALGQSINRAYAAQQAPHPVLLILNISIDQIQNRAPAGLIVEISSHYSFVAREAVMDNESIQTDKSGTATFHTLTGTHEIRVTGEGIMEYTRAISIGTQQSEDVENIVVMSRPVSGPYVVPGAGVVSTTTIHVPEKAGKEFRAGSRALDKKEYDEAKRHFSNATGIYGQYSLAYNGLGVAQMGLGEAAAAHASFEKSVQIDDHFSEGYRNLARLSLAARNFGEMDTLLTRSLLSEPLNAWALTYAAYAELQLHKFDEAIVHARAAHAVPHPGLASVHIVAARALEALKQPGEARKEYELYLDEDPKGRDSARARKAIQSANNPKPE
jgi:hypothetical protein